eukprot:82214-Pelagomonas_calceolata.AAC.9
MELYGALVERVPHLADALEAMEWSGCPTWLMCWRPWRQVPFAPAKVQHRSKFFELSCSVNPSPHSDGVLSRRPRLLQHSKAWLEPRPPHSDALLKVSTRTTCITFTQHALCLQVLGRGPPCCNIPKHGLNPGPITATRARAHSAGRVRTQQAPRALSAEPDSHVDVTNQLVLQGVSAFSTIAARTCVAIAKQTRNNNNKEQ